MTMYHLISTKGSRTVTGLAQAIAAAKAMDAELQPSYGVTVEDDGGDTVAEVDEASVVIDGSMLDDLRSEAEAAGDAAQVAICDRAIEGDVGAVLECVRVISHAQAQADEVRS